MKSKTRDVDFGGTAKASVASTSATGERVGGMEAIDASESTDEDEEETGDDDVSSISSFGCDRQATS